MRCVARALVTETILGRKHDEIRLRPVKRSRKPQDRAIILSDIHVPHHDQKALAVALAYMEDAQPSHIILNGDIVDEAPTASYDKDPREIVTLEDEFSETRALLARIRKAHPKAAIFFTMGNHEDRLERYLVRKAPEMGSDPDLAICSKLELYEFGIKFVDSTSCVRFGPFEIRHGDVVRKGGGNSIRGHMARRGGSMAMGHVHRLAVIMQKDRWGTHYGVENGCLCGLEPSYVSDPDWQQGFTQIDLAGDHVSVRQHHIQNGSLLVDGVIYSA